MKRVQLLFIILFSFTASAQKLYEVEKGMIRFYSEAPQELIKASSKQIKGLIDFERKTFAFKIDIASFTGFNSPLQREHFNENYMETSIFPLARFSGKIIEEVNLAKNASYSVRAKGKLKIHGVEQERIIRCIVKVYNGQVSIQSNFIVLLADHNIKIPRVVNDKLSQEIHVELNMDVALRK